MWRKFQLSDVKVWKEVKVVSFVGKKDVGAIIIAIIIIIIIIIR